MFGEIHQENKNAIEFLDEHAFYYDEEDEQWLKEKDELWAKNIPCYKEYAVKIVLNSFDFDFDMQNKYLDEFLKNLAACDSSPQPEVLALALSTYDVLVVLALAIGPIVDAPHAFQIDENEIEEWLKEKDESSVNSIACYNADLDMLELDRELDEFLKVLATQDSSPQPTEVLAPAADEVLAPATEVPTPQRVLDSIVVTTPPTPRWVQDPSPQSILGPGALAHERVYTLVDLVPEPSTRTTGVPAKSPEETFNNIASEQVHVPINYQHHLLLQNTESNHVMLFGDSSLSIRPNKYTHWTKEEHRSFLLGVEKYKQGGWKNISKKIVPTKTSTQVASHAKKYFKRKNAPKKERKRRSIHDTTLEDIDMIVTPHIDQHNWVLPPSPNFSVQPHEIQLAQHIQRFNLHSSSHQVDEFRNFNSGHQQNELDLVVQHFLHKMPHQMSEYEYSNDWSYDIEYKNFDF